MINWIELLRFMCGFYGYGNIKGPYWIIGIEEKCDGENPALEVQNRLGAWAQLGFPPIAHRPAFVEAAQLPQGNPPRYYRNIARLVLSAEPGEPPTHEQVDEFCNTRLGYQNDNNCLLELLPLPAPGQGNWFYANHVDLAQIPFLQSRGRYERRCSLMRASEIRKTYEIADPRPRVVFFVCGDQGRQIWFRSIVAHALANAFQIVTHPQSGSTFSWYQNDGTVFIATEHTGSYAYFDFTGRWVNNLVHAQ